MNGKEKMEAATAAVGKATGAEEDALHRAVVALEEYGLAHHDAVAFAPSLLKVGRDMSKWYFETAPVLHTERRGVQPRSDSKLDTPRDSQESPK